MSLRQLAAQRPVLAAVACAASQFLLTILILKVGFTLAPPEAAGKVKLVAFASTVVLPLALAHVLGLWLQLGFEIGKVRPAPVFIVSLASCALFLWQGVHPREHTSFAGESLMQFVNAFGEELLFRGVIFALLLSQPRWKAIVLNGLLFGAMHLIHGYMDGNWQAALWQAGVTSIAGMMFTAVRYGSGSLWLTILLHMFLNLSILFSNVELAGGPMAILMERIATVFQLALAGYVIVAGGVAKGAVTKGSVPSRD